MTRSRSSYRGYDRGDFGRRRDGDSGYARDDRSSSADGVGSFLETSLREHPLLLGLGAALAGAVVGTLIPNSRYEHDAMGEHRNRLVDEGMQRGRSVARDALSGAERAIDAAVEEFSNEFESAEAEDSEQEGEGSSKKGEQDGAKASESSGDANGSGDSGGARKKGASASGAAGGDAEKKKGGA